MFSFLQPMPDIVKPLAVILEIPGACDGPLATGQELRQRGKRVFLSLVLHLLVIDNRASDLRVIAVLDFFARGNTTQGEAKRGKPFLMLGVNLLGRFFRLLLRLVHGNQLQLVRATVNLRNRLQNGIGILRRHGIKLTHTLLPIEILDGAQIGIQLVNDTVDLQVGKARIDFIGRIYPERKGNALAPVELLQSFVDIVRIPNFTYSGKEGLVSM